MGPKKGGVHDKKEAAKEREDSKKKEASSKASKAKEDEFWAAAGEGDMSKAAKKKEEEAKKTQEAAAKKLEAKKLAEEEERQLAKPKAAKAPVVGVQKVGACRCMRMPTQNQDIEQTTDGGGMRMCMHPPCTVTDTSQRVQMRARLHGGRPVLFTPMHMA